MASSLSQHLGPYYGTSRQFSPYFGGYGIPTMQMVPHGAGFSGASPGRIGPMGAFGGGGHYESAGSVRGQVKQGHAVSSGTQQPGQQPQLRQWGGSAGSMAGVERNVRQAKRRYDRFQAGRVRGGEDGGETPGVPESQLALGAGAPQAYQGWATHGPGRPQGPGPLTALGPARTPALGGGNAAIGALGPATARPGSAAPTPRPHGPILEASSTPVLPGTGEDVIPRIGGVLPSTRSVRGRKSSFSPNQGTLL